MTIVGRTLAAGSALPLVLVAQALAQNAPPPGQWTVIVHGRTGSCSHPGNYNGLIGTGGWMRQLAARIEGLSPGNVNTYRIDAATMGLITVNAGGTTPLDPARHHVVMFDWGATSDFDPILCQAPSGSQNGFAFAAGDAVFTLLKQWNASGSVFGLIGYSRGAVVVSETARRLMVDGTNPGQVVFVDGEGCEAGGGNGCTFYDDGRFDAWAPPSGSVRFDNLYETVNERYLAPAVCSTDLGGHARPRCNGLNLGTSFAHTVWSLTSSCLPSYNQPPILTYLTGGLTVSNGRYTYPGVPGPIQDPSPPAASSQPIPVPFNGGFTTASLAGWIGNGGGGAGTVSSLGGVPTLRLTLTQSHATNFFPLPMCAASLRCAAAVDGAAVGDSMLSIVIQASGVPDQELGPVPLSQLPPAPGPLQQFSIPGAFQGKVARVRFAVTGTTGQAGLHITGVSLTPCPATCYANCDGSSASPVLTANDFLCYINQFASGTSYANCDQSTSVPQLTANDFLCYINAFASGCS